MINEPWAIVAVCGFWGWVLTTIGFIFKAFPRQRQFAPIPGTFWGMGLVLFFCVWLIGMLNA